MKDKKIGYLSVNDLKMCKEFDLKKFESYKITVETAHPNHQNGSFKLANLYLPP